jgi:hypothetical protein
MMPAVQRGRRGEVSPAPAKTRSLGDPKKTRSCVNLHSRISREARIFARQRGRSSPPPRLGGIGDDGPMKTHNQQRI